MQYIQRYNPKLGKAGEARAWLVKNAKAFADSAPPGWTYLGEWFTARGFGQYMCERRWEIDDYNALGEGFGTETHQKLALEYLDFIDTSRGGETALMKSATEIAIMDGV